MFNLVLSRHFQLHRNREYKVSLLTTKPSENSKVQIYNSR